MNFTSALRKLGASIGILVFMLPVNVQPAFGKSKLDELQAHPPIHAKHHISKHSFISSPYGLSPQIIRPIYHLSSSGGGGKTIAIIDAYDDPYAQNDLNIFSSTYSLPQCDSTNQCFEKHKMANKIFANSGWALEESLDVQWAHAIAPDAKILLVEAQSSSLSSLLNAVDYARSRSDVTAISMSWGAGEFSGSQSYDFHFTGSNRNGQIGFFASSGDSGTGVQWPAVSQNVTGVGGTTLHFDSSGNFTGETAWNGSGGGISSFVSEPSFQTSLVTNSNNERAVPDVSYDADPNSGVSVYDSLSYYGQSGWWQVGGTSAGAPQWAAIKALGSGFSNANLYPDAINFPTDFRDITTGTNGSCGSVCTAVTGYDFITGLGSPQTSSY